MWRRIIAWFLFGLGFLTVTFFRRYHGDLIPHPFLFFLLGLGMFLGGILFLRYTPSTSLIKAQKKIAETIKDLKENGEKILVDLNKCQLKGNSYMEERELYGNDNELLTFGFEREIQSLNAMGGEAMQNVEQVEINQTVIIYTRMNNRSGSLEKFVSRIIEKDEITLSFYMDRQKETTLYVDKVDRQRYYFDLDFLNT